MSFFSINSFNFYLNIVAGMWMSNLSEIVPSFGARVALYTLNIVSDACVILALVSFSINVFSPNVPIAERCIGTFITIIAFQSVSKTLYFYFNQKKLQRFIEMWDRSLIVSYTTDEGRKLIDAERRKVKIISIVLLIVLALPSFIWSGSATIPAMQALHGGRFMPIPGYFPYDALSSPMYEVTLAWELAVGWFMMSKVVAFDGFFFTLAAQEIVHLKQLKGRLEKMFDPSQLIDVTADRKTVGDHKRNSRKHPRLQSQILVSNVEIAAMSSSTTIEQQLNIHLSYVQPIPMITVNRRDTELLQTSQNNEAIKILKTRLKIWIQHHQEVVRFITEINQFYSPILLIQFLTSILILCFSAFVAAEVDSLNVMQWGAVSLNTLSHLGHLLVLCRLGDRIAGESESLSDAGLDNGWQHCKVKEVLTSLKIVYHRTQIPLQISALGVFPLSADTFVAITRAAISYLMVLIDLKQKNN